MHVIERFCAAASDGRMVEILMWGPRHESSTQLVEGERAVYATLTGRRVTRTSDDHYAIPSLGITVRRQR